jgi:hydrogenase/urease accessory protein HupE
MRRWSHFPAAVLLMLWLWAPFQAHAHAVDSASLVLSEVTPGRFLVRFQSASPALAEQVTVPAVFPKPCQLQGEMLDCGPAGLSGTLEFPWLAGALTDFMVDIEWRDGSRLLRVVNASTPSLTVYEASASGLRSLAPLVGDYIRLGIEHILTGFDHVFFVVGLTFLVRRRRALLGTITAFTVAHSLTLAATSLGLLEVPGAPVEALIAASIVLVCAECLRPSDSLTRQAPWLVAFAFGLLHGLGFASALLEIGLPARHIPTALFSFNVGVEIGQLLVIGVVLSVRALATRLKMQRAWMGRAVVYGMGSTAAFWCLDRVLQLFQS